MRVQLVADFVSWRWTPFFALVVGAFLYVAIVVLVLPSSPGDWGTAPALASSAAASLSGDDLEELASEGPLRRTLGAPAGKTQRSIRPSRTSRSRPRRPSVTRSPTLFDRTDSHAEYESIRMAPAPLPVVEPPTPVAPPPPPPPPPESAPPPAPEPAEAQSEEPAEPAQAQQEQGADDQEEEADDDDEAAEDAQGADDKEESEEESDEEAEEKTEEGAEAPPADPSAGPPG